MHATFSRILLVAGVAAAPLVVPGCGSSNGMTAPTSNSVIAMTGTASGNGQTAQVGTSLPNPLRVVVMLNGAPQPGKTVSWAAAGIGASVGSPTSLTDASGIAITTWTLGQTAGSQTASATLAGASSSPVAFSSTATAGAAAQLTLSSGNSQTAGINTAFTSPLVVKVADQFGNAVAGDSVSWVVTSGSAVVSPAKSASGASGMAQASLSAGGTAGAVTVTATSAGLTGSPATFGSIVETVAATAAVNVGDDFFKSARNSSQNPAVDTIAVGGKVTWTWVGALGHSVQSLGSPSFTSSAIMASGTYSFTFLAAGTYHYDCAVHGVAMTGTIVVK